MGAFGFSEDALGEGEGGVGCRDPAVDSGLQQHLVCLTLVPLVTTRSDHLNLLILILLGIMLAQSWNILAGFAGQINLGHAAFFGVGALTTRLLWLQGLPIGPVEVRPDPASSSPASSRVGGGG